MNVDGNYTFPFVVMICTHGISLILHHFCGMAQKNYLEQQCLQITQKEGLNSLTFKVYMVDTQLVKWTQKYFCSPDQKWKIFLDHLVTKFGGKTLFVSNYTIELLIKMEDIPMLRAWSKSDIHYDIVGDGKSEASILEQCVWNNQFLTANGKTIYCKPLMMKQDCLIIQFDFWKAKGVSNKYYLQYKAIVHSVVKKWKSIHSANQCLKFYGKIMVNKLN